MTDLARRGEHESALEARCVKLLKAEGGWLLKLQGVTGIPDRIALLDGRVAFVEFKTRRGRLSDAQRLAAIDLSRMGFQVFTVRDETGFRSVMYALGTKA